MFEPVRSQNSSWHSLWDLRGTQAPQLQQSSSNTGNWCCQISLVYDNWCDHENECKCFQFMKTISCYQSWHVTWNSWDKIHFSHSRFTTCDYDQPNINNYLNHESWLASSLLATHYPSLSIHDLVANHESWIATHDLGLLSLKSRVMNRGLCVTSHAWRPRQSWLKSHFWLADT